jgi:PAS domain S-box-containing protein
MMTETPYDAIVSDFQMPDMNGIELLKRVRAVNSGIPFILFTEGTGRSGHRGPQQRGDFYIQKGGDPVSQFLELEYKIKQAVMGHRTEMDLRRSEERFRSLIEDAPIAITIVQNDLISYANPHFLTMFGLSELSEVVGRPMQELIVSMDQVRSTPRALPGMRVPRRADNEFMGMRKWGSMFPVHIAFSQVHLSDGTGVLAFVTDITERLRSEDALRRSEGKFRAIFSEAAVGIAITDLSGWPREFNDELVRFFGYSRSELSQMCLFDLTHPDDREKERDTLDELFVGRIKTHEAGMRFVRKDGQVKWAHVTLTVLDKVEEDLPLILVIIKDITDEMKRDEERSATMTQLSLAMDIGEFAPWEYDVKTKTYTFNDGSIGLWHGRQEGGRLPHVGETISESSCTPMTSVG